MKKNIDTIIPPKGMAVVALINNIRKVYNTGIDQLPFNESQAMLRISEFVFIML